MMRPPSPCSRNRIAAARAHVNVPRRWVCTTRSKSSSVIFHSTLSRSTPALVTMTSRRPYASTARATSASAVSVDPTAPGAATPPIASATSSAPSRSLTTTFAPAAASASA